MARGRDVTVSVYGHRPGEPAVAADWWPAPCLIFTEFGSWAVRSSTGRADVHSGVLVAGAGRADYELTHPNGVEDRNLVLHFETTDPLPDGRGAAVVPVAGRIAALRRDLRRHVATAAAGRDPGELDALGWALSDALRAPAPPPAVGPH